MSWPIAVIAPQGRREDGAASALNHSSSPERVRGRIPGTAVTAMGRGTLAGERGGSRRLAGPGEKRRPRPTAEHGRWDDVNESQVPCRNAASRGYGGGRPCRPPRRRFSGRAGIPCGILLHLLASRGGGRKTAAAIASAAALV